MKKISAAQKNVLSILGKAKPSEQGYRLLKYCVQESVDGGVLLFNLLTRELLLLTDEEWAQRIENDYLKAHWFVVPENLDEKKHADMVKWVLRSTAKKPSAITSYTILTTTDCNARCFYCFEKGRSRIPMSKETAHKTARYIIDHCGGAPVTLNWFGGEPLFNAEVIDLICEELQHNGIQYRSRMTSNGYLFDEKTVQKSKNLWNLKRVQITLDGTEAVYNRSKAYIYREGSPYQVVMANIGRLLDAGVSIQIRLNLDLYNADNLLALVEELAERFGNRKGLFVYAHHLFDTKLTLANTHSDEEWEKRYEAMYLLNERISRHGLVQQIGIDKKLRLKHCMADSGSAVIIVPTGDIGLCEHHTEDEFIGHIDRENFDADIVARWREMSPEISECADCFYYPACLRLKKCTVGSSCFRQLREATLRETKQSMQQEYRLWLAHAPEEEQEEAPFC